MGINVIRHLTGTLRLLWAYIVYLILMPFFLIILLRKTYQRYVVKILVLRLFLICIFTVLFSFSDIFKFLTFQCRLLLSSLLLREESMRIRRANDYYQGLVLLSSLLSKCDTSPKWLGSSLLPEKVLCIFS